MSKLSIRLKELREEKGLSSRELAKKLNVSDRAVQRWEKGERVPNADSVILLARFFDVSADYLLGLED
jgi:transcriptional regulator with XRE-family HTH domain